MRRWFYPDTMGVAESLGLVLLRVAMGAAFLAHGWPKVNSPFNWMGTHSSTPDIFQIFAALTEFGSGLMLIPGLLTRIAAIGIATTMVGEMLLLHIPAGNPFVGQPGQASYELVLVYVTGSVLLFLTGAGQYSLDHILFKGVPEVGPTPPSMFGRTTFAQGLWTELYGIRKILEGRVVQNVGSRIQLRPPGPRDQGTDDAIFEPLAQATVIAISQGDYQFAIELFHKCYGLARAYEDANNCEVHKGAMTFNAGIAYLRANDFPAAMHYLQLSQVETCKTTGNDAWGVYDSDLFDRNFWRLLDLYEQQSPLQRYREFWGVPFSAAAAHADWTRLSPHSKLLYIIINAERISFRRLGDQPHMAVSESFSLSYWNLIADLARLLETELVQCGIGGGGLRAKVLNLNPVVLADYNAEVNALHAAHPVNSPSDFNVHFPALQAIIQSSTESIDRRVAAAALLAGVTRNQVQHQVEKTMIIFTDRISALFTAETLLCLCRLDDWIL